MLNLLIKLFELAGQVGLLSLCHRFTRGVIDLTRHGWHLDFRIRSHGKARYQAKKTGGNKGEAGPGQRPSRDGEDGNRLRHNQSQEFFLTPQRRGGRQKEESIQKNGLGSAITDNVFSEQQEGGIKFIPHSDIAIDSTGELPRGKHLVWLYSKGFVKIYKKKGQEK